MQAGAVMGDPQEGPSGAPTCRQAAAFSAFFPVHRKAFDHDFSCGILFFPRCVPRALASLSVPVPPTPHVPQSHGEPQTRALFFKVVPFIS